MKAKIQNNSEVYCMPLTNVCFQDWQMFALKLDASQSWLLLNSEQSQHKHECGPVVCSRRYLILHFQQGRQKAGRIKTDHNYIDSPKSRREQECLHRVLIFEGEERKQNPIIWHMFQF